MVNGQKIEYPVLVRRFLLLTLRKRKAFFPLNLGRCSPNITVEHSRTSVHGQTAHDGSFLDGTEIVYECLENFRHDPRSGSLSIRCRAGRWDPLPKCIGLYANRRKRDEIQSNNQIS